MMGEATLAIIGCFQTNRFLQTPAGIELKSAVALLVWLEVFLNWATQGSIPDATWRRIEPSALQAHELDSTGRTLAIIAVTRSDSMHFLAKAGIRSMSNNIVLMCEHSHMESINNLHGSAYQATMRRASSQHYPGEGARGTDSRWLALPRPH